MKDLLRAYPPCRAEQFEAAIIEAMQQLIQAGRLVLCNAIPLAHLGGSLLRDSQSEHLSNTNRPTCDFLFNPSTSAFEKPDKQGHFPTAEMACALLGQEQKLLMGLCQGIRDRAR